MSLLNTIHDAISDFLDEQMESESYGMHLADHCLTVVIRSKDKRLTNVSTLIVFGDTIGVNQSHNYTQGNKITHREKYFPLTDDLRELGFDIADWILFEVI